MKIYCSHINTCMGKAKDDLGIKRREVQQKVCAKGKKELEYDWATKSYFCLLIGRKIYLGR